MKFPLVGLIVALAACNQPTHFVGDAKFPNGATGCRTTCSADGLDMIGFVYSGEYSTSCVCGVRGAQPASASDSAPSAGVTVQAQAAAAAAAAEQQRQMQQQQQQRRTTM